MTDTGAITLAIEALEIADNYLEDGKYIGFKHKKVERALEALKVFKDGVPEGLGDNVENIIIHNQYIETKEVKADIMVFYKAAKYLQEGIK